MPTKVYQLMSYSDKNGKNNFHHLTVQTEEKSVYEKKKNMYPTIELDDSLHTFPQLMISLHAVIALLIKCLTVEI